jgi:lysozyme
LLIYTLPGFVTDVRKMCQNKGDDNQIGAFVDLAYNIGDTNFGSSSALKYFLNGNVTSVGFGIEMWDKSGGKVLKGLQRRRRAERLVFYGAAVVTALKQAEKDYP